MCERTEELHRELKGQATALQGAGFDNDQIAEAYLAFALGMMANACGPAMTARMLYLLAQNLSAQAPQITN